MKHSLLLLLLSCAFLSIEAQQPPSIRIEAEYGFSNLSGKINDHWEFRHPPLNYSDYGYYYENEHAVGEGTLLYGGARATLSAWKDRVTIASGLRYTNIQQRILPSGNTPYLYLYPGNTQYLHPEQSAIRGIDIFRLNGMEESLGYVSIPLEVDIILLGYYSNWQVYAKAGLQAGAKIHGTTRIDFVSPSMQEYENEVIAATNESPGTFFSTAYGGLGLRLILQNGTRISAEMISSHLFLSKPNFSFLSPETFPGIQFMVSFPIQLSSFR